MELTTLRNGCAVGVKFGSNAAGLVFFLPPALHLSNPQRLLSAASIENYLSAFSLCSRVVEYLSDACGALTGTAKLVKSNCNPLK